MKMQHKAGINDMEWSVSVLKERDSTTRKRNYTLTTEVVTIQDYMDETDARWEDVVISNGAFVSCFVRAVLEDEETGFMWRVFTAVELDNFIEHTRAISEATMMLMQEYYAYLHNKGLA